MKNNVVLAAEEIAMFCRLQMQVRKGLPIRSSEMGVLIFVQKQIEPVTPLMISNFFQIAKPSVTSMITELVNNDYLTKEPSSTDKRSYTVSLTAKGQELVATTHDEYFRSIELIKEKMGTEDFNTFLKLIQSANEILREARI